MAAGKLTLVARGRNQGANRRRTGRMYAIRSLRRKGFNPSRWVPRVSLVPDRMFVKLKYSQTLRMSSTSGALDTQIFNGNNPIDPDWTSAGAGPNAYGLDQWSIFYGKCYISSCNVEARIMPNDNGNSKIIMYPTIYAVPPANLDNAQSHARAQVRLINGGEGGKVMKAHFTTKAVTGEPWNIAQTMFLTAGSTPNSTWYITFAYAGVPENTPPVDTGCNLTVTLTYNCLLYNRNQALGAPLSGGGGSSS